MNASTMNRRALSFCLTALLFAAAAEGRAMADTDALRADVEHLASDELDGRETGSDGARKAAAFLSERLRELGAEPYAGAVDYRWPFEYTADSADLGSNISLERGGDQRSWNTGDGILGLSFSDVGMVSGEVVFAGYGITVPAGADFAYDSYVGLDVSDKIVLVLRYFPEDADEEIRSELARYSHARYKAMSAREKGAKAILVVSGPNSPNAGEVIPLRGDTAAAGSGIIGATISGEVAEALLEMARVADLATQQSKLDSANPHVTGFALEGVTVDLDVNLERRHATDASIVGVLPATMESDGKAIILGAHYDHLGHGDGGNSLADKSEAGQIHHGADDNASGTAAVLAMGRTLVDSERPRPIVLAFWSGEEIGLIGSESFCKAVGFDPTAIWAYLNFDMVGRLRDDRLTLQSVGSSSVWPSIIERANISVGLDLKLNNDPFVPTDATSLYKADVPTLHFFTGAHEDYHRPTDTADKINYEGLDLIVELGANIVSKLMVLQAQPDFVVVAPTKQESGDRDAARAYTGTIPDYTSEIDGLRLSGVINGGPADKAGLVEGDIIIEFNGKEITNIYDYTYALDTVKVGVEAKIVIRRGEEKLELNLTPEAR
jgi:hypothetical protein